MRIGFLTPEYVTETNSCGGLSNYLGRITLHLARSGHEVHVFVFSGVAQEVFNHNGVLVHRIPCNVPSLANNRWFRRLGAMDYHYALEILEKNVLGCLTIAQQHRKTPFDIIQVPHMSGIGILTTLLGGEKVVLRVSGYSKACDRLRGHVASKPDTAITAWAETVQFNLASNIFSPSKLIKHLLEIEEDIHNIEVLQTPFFNEVQKEDISLHETYLKGKKYLLYFGNFQIYKGVIELTQALYRVMDACPDLTMVFAGGDIPTRVTPSMHDYIRSSLPHLADRLYLFDTIPHSQLYPIIKHARAVVLPSLIDNMPNTMLEAMSLGKPVIGTIGASFDEFITDGENGFLVPLGDSDSLAKKLIEVWNRSDLDTIGKNAAESMLRMAPDIQVDNLLTYYKTITESPKSKHRFGHMAVLKAIKLAKKMIA